MQHDDLVLLVPEQRDGVEQASVLLPMESRSLNADQGEQRALGELRERAAGMSVQPAGWVFSSCSVSVQVRAALALRGASERRIG